MATSSISSPKNDSISGSCSRYADVPVREPGYETQRQTAARVRRQRAQIVADFEAYRRSAESEIKKANALLKKMRGEVRTAAAEKKALNSELQNRASELNVARAQLTSVVTALKNAKFSVLNGRGESQVSSFQSELEQIVSKESAAVSERAQSENQTQIQYSTPIFNNDVTSSGEKSSEDEEPVSQTVQSHHSRSQSPVELNVMDESAGPEPLSLLNERMCDAGEDCELEFYSVLSGPFSYSEDSGYNSPIPIHGAKPWAFYVPDYEALLRRARFLEEENVQLAQSLTACITRRNLLLRELESTRIVLIDNNTHGMSSVVDAACDLQKPKAQEVEHLVELRDNTGEVEELKSQVVDLKQKNETLRGGVEFLQEEVGRLTAEVKDLTAARIQDEQDHIMKLEHMALSYQRRRFSQEQDSVDSQNYLQCI